MLRVLYSYLVLRVLSSCAGYDIVFGNPVDISSSDYLDPGFRQNIVVQLFDARRVSGSYQEVSTSILRAWAATDSASVSCVLTLPFVR